jgi:predicted  nucleic acid-binding Zn-ribbon protein
VELEKDIAKLNEEIMKLKYENKQLQAGKAELQQQLKEQKENSDDTIAQLRSKPAYLSPALCVPVHRPYSRLANFCYL